MKLKEGMLLFHGSYTKVESIDLNQCLKGKDFGKGFYLTSDPNQATCCLEFQEARKYVI